MSSGAIAGIVVGVGAALVVMALATYIIVSRRRAAASLPTDSHAGTRQVSASYAVVLHTPSLS